MECLGFESVERAEGPRVLQTMSMAAHWALARNLIISGTALNIAWHALMSQQVLCKQANRCSPYICGAQFDARQEFGIFPNVSLNLSNKKSCIGFRYRVPVLRDGKPANLSIGICET